MNLVNKTVNLNNIETNGDLTEQFAKQALKQGWTQEEVDKVVNEAQSKDYDYMIQVMLEHSNIDAFEDVSNEDETIDLDDVDDPNMEVY